MNAGLQEAIDASELDEETLANIFGVDPKTVTRWISGRVPYPRYRRMVAELLNADEAALWPQAEQQTTQPMGEPADIQAAYAHRWAVPREVWRRLFASAEQEICILAYAALFLAEDAGVMNLLADKARAGVSTRMLLGDPDSSRVAERGMGEGIGDAISAKIRNAFVLYRPLAEIDGVEIRLHHTPLYASLYRADAELLINVHAYGAAAAHSPVLHIRHTEADDMANTYLDSFEKIWTSAEPLDLAEIP